jgi:polyhydroxyalkanoate synthase
MAAQVPASRVPHAEPLDLPLKSMLARDFKGLSPASIGMAYYDWLAHLAVSPTKHAELASSALRKTLAWLHTRSRPPAASARVAVARTTPASCLRAPCPRCDSPVA